ncbi:MAG: arylesterase [Casimicrobiaceae bacterium]
MLAHLMRAGAGALALVAALILAATPAFAAAPAAAGVAPAGGSVARAPVILIVGDSISAAYGLSVESGWARLLAQRLQADRHPQSVVNASISGDTTAGGRARLPELLKQHRPAIVVIELGGNDGLRGGDLGAMRANLDAMVAAAKKTGARVLLVGMRMPPNYGLAYTRAFDAVYTDVARKHDVPLVPFFFEGFGETSEWFQPDRIHPTAAAQPRLLDNVWPTLKPLLEPRR